MTDATSLRESTVITRRVEANGVKHHVLEWRPPRGEGSVVLLLHGAKDRGTSFDEVAPRLARAGFSVFAPDLRGHGATESGPGGYQLEYFVADVAELVDILSPGRPVFLVGHSFGGVVATLYAGTFPARLHALGLVEGLGLAAPEAESPDRLRIWTEASRRDRNRPPRRVTKEHAARSLASWHPEVAPSLIERRVSQLTIEADAKLAWRFDPLQWHILWELSFARWRAHAVRVTAPTLIVSGGGDRWRPADVEERKASFSTVKTVEIPAAGHMVHWTAPVALAEALLEFARSAALGPSATSVVAL